MEYVVRGRAEKTVAAGVRKRCDGDYSQHDDGQALACLAVELCLCSQPCQHSPEEDAKEIKLALHRHGPQMLQGRRGVARRSVRCILRCELPVLVVEQGGGELGGKLVTHQLRCKQQHTRKGCK